MYLQTSRTGPACIRMRPSPAAQYFAVQNLIRPWEVEYLVAEVPWWEITRGHSFAVEVADWLRERLSYGVLNYIPDPEARGTTDFWCSPSATMLNGGGDCEDLAILAVSLLRAGGVDAFVVTGRVWTDHGFQGHAWVEGWDPSGFFMIEATSGELLRRRPRFYRAQLLLGPDVFRLAA